MSVFEVRYPLRFGDCDPAGIAFFPRLVEMLNWVMEDWFAEALGSSFRDMHLRRQVGTPARALTVEFIGPAELGDELAFRLSVLGLGRSSIRLSIAVSRGGDRPVLRAEHTAMWCDLSGEAPVSTDIPADLRARMERFLDSSEPEPDEAVRR